MRQVPERGIEAYYNLGLERGRLDVGPGQLEFIRTEQLLTRFLPKPPVAILDVGGGAGRYAVPLASRGYDVHLIDPIQLHVDQARQTKAPRVTASVGDARQLDVPDESVDAVIMLGPLYHLTERADRVKALSEARRVCRDGGVILAAAISRWASTLDGMLYGDLADPTFAVIAANDRRDGQHRNPTDNPNWFTTAYFHAPAELAHECSDAGLTHEATLAIEGPGWLLSDVTARLAEARGRKVLLDAIEALEAEPSAIGVSAHLMIVARR